MVSAVAVGPLGDGLMRCHLLISGHVCVVDLVAVYVLYCAGHLFSGGVVLGRVCCPLSDPMSRASYGALGHCCVCRPISVGRAIYISASTVISSVSAELRDSSLDLS